MIKYLKLFETTSDYEAYINGEGVVLPNVSVAKDAPKIVYYNPIPPFFAKLSLNNGEVVELQGSGQLTPAMVSPYRSSLVSAEIGELCTNIGFQAFGWCDGLTSITIPNSVTSIGSSAFWSCDNLTSVTIGSGVTSIGSSAFSGCEGLTSIVVNSANTVYDSRDNCNAIVNTSTNELIAGCKNTVIPNTVTSIGNYAFAYCDGLTSITIPDSVTNIGKEAFARCYDLTSVTIGSGVTSIGQQAFGWCTDLTSITCNATTAPTIDNSTFQNIKTGGTLTVPSGSTGYDTWMGTGNYYLGKYGWTKVEPFFAKLSLDNGEVVELQGSGELTEEMVSQYKPSLVSAEIGESCTSIGNFAFSSCTSLTSITSLATTAPTIEWGTFDRVKTNGTLTVPSGSTGYDEWMYYLDEYSWTMKEQ